MPVDKPTITGTGVGGSLEDFLSDNLRGESPSGITGNVCAISACRTCAGLFFLRSLTVVDRVGGCLSLSLVATGFLLGEPAAIGEAVANLTFVGDGLVGDGASSCCLREAKYSGVPTSGDTDICLVRAGEG